MKSLLTIFIVIAFTNVQSQNVLMKEKTGLKEIACRITANSDAQLFTSCGSFYLADIDYLKFDERKKEDEPMYSKLMKGGVKCLFGNSIPEIVDHLAPLPGPQALPWVNGSIVYSEVCRLDSLNQDEIYKREKRFFIDGFKSSKDVIQLDDKESGTIIGKAFQDVIVEMPGLIKIPISTQMWYSVKLQSKAGRYKYEVYDIKFRAYPSQYNLNPKDQSAENMFSVNSAHKTRSIKQTMDSYLQEMNLGIKRLIESIKISMAANSKDDW